MTPRSTDPQRSMPWLFPIVYLTITHSTTGLLVIVGLVGNPVLAADIALVQGATIATFHALSANTRALILGQSRVIAVSDILRMRLALIAPLALAAYALATAGTGVATWLAVCIVVRRCGEWFNDVQLCKAELAHRLAFATGFLALQVGLFAAAAIALITGWEHAPLALAVWALVPLALAFGLRKDLSGEHSIGFVRMLRRVFPHAGSTAISGLALYALRVFVVLLIAKELAGTLFTAIAIGSFIGTLFANVLGPSLDLHERETGRGLPTPMKIVIWGIFGIGLVITIAAAVMPASLQVLGKPKFFWLACGLSLIGGVVMVAAQRLRLRIMRSDDGRDIFGPEVLLHIAILVAAPMLVIFGGPIGITALYFLNAVFAYLLYRSSEMAQRWITVGEPRYLGWLRFSVGFFIVFPLFFQILGGIYNSREVMLDSGGRLLSLPLPVSIVACFLGLVLLADYRRATRSFAFISFFFAAMFLSAVVTKPPGEAFDRANLLLSIQCLVPAFGLALGEMFEAGRAGPARVLERAFFWACATIIPAQLVSSWLQGQAVLTQWVGLFSVYQHYQFVPVVIACATLVSAPVLWHDSAYRRYVPPLLFLALLYALAASSLLPIFVTSVGLLAFGACHMPRLGWKKGLAVSATALVAAGLFAVLVIETPGNILKGKLMPRETLQEEYAQPCEPEVGLDLSSLVEHKGDAWVIQGQAPAPDASLIECRSKLASRGDAIVVEGNVRRGGVTVGLIGADSSLALQRRIDHPGEFQIELHPNEGQYRAVVTSYLPQGAAIDITIARFAWLPSVTKSPTVVAGDVPETLARILPFNLVERIGDWMLFGRPIFSSVETFLFGHSRPLSRSVRTSAHNYYIDLAYNLGTVALLPIAGLLFYTLRLVWLRRHEVWLNDRLAWMVAMVLFLLVVDSNFKVTLRQPYPGIFAFFLWGVLLARLRSPDVALRAARPAVASPQAANA